MTRPRGRPPTGRARSVTVRFRCTPACRDYLMRAAERQAETLSDYLRELAITEAADTLGDDWQEAMERLDETD